MGEPSFTAWSLLAGLLIGTFFSLSNTYYGLQIGVASQMSMVSGLLGFAGFKACSRYLTEPFTPAENVLVISVATSCGCMPVTAGLIGVVPALEFLINKEENGPMVLPLGTIFVWSVALSLFGLIFASLFRQDFIVRDKLPWPGARATANLIATLHNEGKPMRSPQTAQDDQTLQSSSPNSNSLEPETAWTEKLRTLSQGAGAAGIISIVIYFIPILRQLPVFGRKAATSWLWSVDLSPGFFGQGIITGPVITLHMLLGAIVGWGVLSPYARNQGWAPGDVDDWSTGSRGWIIWVSLAALLADASIKMAWLLLNPILKKRMLIQTYLRSIWKSNSGHQPLLRPARTQYMEVEQNSPDGLSAQDRMADQRPTPRNQSTSLNDNRMHSQNHPDHWRTLTAASSSPSLSAPSQCSYFSAV
uniref:Oligopeptide transporter n=1 Tax=Bionectria ochroleuca TaxID=29856 RepID=A0A8H7K9Z1_BIOOC